MAILTRRGFVVGSAIAVAQVPSAIAHAQTATAASPTTPISGADALALAEAYMQALTSMDANGLSALFIADGVYQDTQLLEHGIFRGHARIVLYFTDAKKEFPNITYTKRGVEVVPHPRDPNQYNAEVRWRQDGRHTGPKGLAGGPTGQEISICGVDWLTIVPETSPGGQIQWKIKRAVSAYDGEDFVAQDSGKL